MVDNDEALIQKAADGDRAAFESLYRAHAGFVYNVAVRIVRHTEDAEEVTQEVFLTLYRKLKTFRFGSSLKTWIYRVTSNEALSFLRKRSGSDKRRVSEEILERVPSSERLDQGLIQADKKAAVASLLENLNPNQRACLVLREMEGLSYAEIAHTLSVNVNTVRTWLKRARENLMDQQKAAPHEV